MLTADSGSITAGLASAASGLVLFVVLIGAAASAVFGGNGLTGSGGCSAPSPATLASTGLDQEQLTNASTIISVAAQMNLPSQAAVIAVATAMQESDLQNLDYGDRDSLGLFQQRPSQGWGTPAEILDPEYAARAFYTRLAQIPGWQSLPLTVAAQDVQHSATPAAYAQWQQLAETVVSDLGEPGSCPNVAASGTAVLPSWFQLPAGTPEAIAVAISYALRQLGKPYIWGGTGPAGYDCSGLVMMAYAAAGVSIPRTTYQQVDAGTAVASFSDLLPGDLLFEAGSDGSPSNPGHVGMYIGDGLVIQAPYTGADIDLTPASQWRSATVAIRQVVN
jgi:cell wall-associated NlpC family hydrolase